MKGVWILAADHRDPEQARGHRLWFDGRAGGVSVPEVHDLLEVVDRALDGAAPWVADPSVLEHRPKPVAKHRSASPKAVALGQVLDRSLGLSLALWRAAYWTGLEVPDDVYTSACVRADGGLEPVQHLTVKCLAVPDGARLLVHPENAAAVPQRCVAVPVETMAAAVGAVWPDPVFPDELRNASVAKAAARFVRRHRGTWPWRALATGLAKQDRSHPLVAAGWSIARRHAGDPVGLEACELAESVLLADHLQGVADAAKPWKAVARRARRGLDPKRGPKNDGEAEVFGALGRLYAAWREYELARPWLDAAIRYFLEHDPRAASHVLCERLRIAGIAGERDDALVEEAFASLEHQEAKDRHFLQTALLRYSVKGSAPAVVARLEGSLAEGVSALWAGRCGLQWGRPTREEQALARLHEDPGDRTAIEELRTLTESRVDVQRFERLLRPGEDLRRVMAWEWRY